MMSPVSREHQPRPAVPRAGTGAALLVAWLALGAAIGCVAPSGRASDTATPATGSARATLARGRYLMGTEIEIVVGGLDRERLIDASERAFDEIARIESVFTDWRPGGAVWEINERAGGAPIPVAREVIDVLDRANAVSRETDGAFDVSYRTVGKLWSFSAESERIASDEELRAALPHVGFTKIAIDRAASTVRLVDRATQIGLGGVAKGYAVDRAVEVLEAAGASEGLVNAGGDLAVFRAPGSSAPPARIAVRDPDHADSALAAVAVCNASVHTSGDYERYFERDGVRYHHLLDPRTGHPARGARAVTLVSERDGTRADALATGLFVMGAERAIAWVDAHPGFEALAVAPDGSIRTSRGWGALDAPSAPLATLARGGRPRVDGCGAPR